MYNRIELLLHNKDVSREECGVRPAFCKWDTPQDDRRTVDRRRGHRGTRGSSRGPYTLDMRTSRATHSTGDADAPHRALSRSLMALLLLPQLTPPPKLNRVAPRVVMESRASLPLSLLSHCLSVRTALPMACRSAREDQSVSQMLPNDDADLSPVPVRTQNPLRPWNCSRRAPRTVASARSARGRAHTSS